MPSEDELTNDEVTKDMVQSVHEHVKQKLTSFKTLLDDIERLDDKKKALWQQIYENAITDRENAYIMFLKLYVHVHGDSAQHAIHGPTVSKYLERMGKANDQLIRLAELVADASQKSEKLDPEELFDRIKNRQ